MGVFLLLFGLFIEVKNEAARKIQGYKTQGKIRDHVSIDKAPTIGNRFCRRGLLTFSKLNTMASLSM